MARSVVLLVEDEEESRETLRELLELEGYNVQTALNGQEALTKLNLIGDEICMVLLDLFMPVMDGWQVLDQMRSDGRFATVPIVVTSSAAQNVPTDVPVFRKPIDFDRLLRTVETLC